MSIRHQWTDGSVFAGYVKRKGSNKWHILRSVEGLGESSTILEEDQELSGQANCGFMAANDADRFELESDPPIRDVCLYCLRGKLHPNYLKDHPVGEVGSDD